MQQLDERLKGQYASLSPQEQRVADFIFDHFDDLISYNSAELAQLSGVSKATVSRLFKRLGYDKYKDMRDELRTLRQSGMPLTDQRDAVPARFTDQDRRQVVGRKGSGRRSRRGVAASCGEIALAHQKVRSGTVMTSPGDTV